MRAANEVFQMLKRVEFITRKHQTFVVAGLASPLALQTASKTGAKGHADKEVSLPWCSDSDSGTLFLRTTRAHGTGNTCISPSNGFIRSVGPLT